MIIILHEYQDQIETIKTTIKRKIGNISHLITNNEKYTEVVRIMRLTGEFRCLQMKDEDNDDLEDQTIRMFCDEICNPGYLKEQYWNIKLAIRKRLSQ